MQALGVSTIIMPPTGIQELWSQVPTYTDGLNEYSGPVFSWLQQVAAAGDFILIQGVGC